MFFNKNNNNKKETSDNDPSKQQQLNQLLEENGRLKAENARLVAENTQLENDKRDLEADAQVFLDLLLSPQNNNNNNGPFWKDLKCASFQTDRSIISGAIRLGFDVTWDDIPESLRQGDDMSILDGLLDTDHHSARSQPDLWHGVNLLKRFPILAQDARFWRQTFRYEPDSRALDQFMAWARETPALHNNVDLVIQAYYNACLSDRLSWNAAISRDKESVLELLDLDVRQENVKIFEALKRPGSWKALSRIPFSMQLQHPDIVSQKLQEALNATSWSATRATDLATAQVGIAQHIAPQLWQEPNFLLFWLKQFGTQQDAANRMNNHYLLLVQGLDSVGSNDLQEQEVKKDFWWKVASNGGKHALSVFQQHCPDSLLSDDAFLRKAVMLQPRPQSVQESLYLLCSRTRRSSSSGSDNSQLRTDKELALHVLNQVGDLYFYQEEEEGRDDRGRPHQPQPFLSQTLRDDFHVKLCALVHSQSSVNMERMDKIRMECMPRVMAKLQAYHGFVKVVLPAMSASLLLLQSSSSSNNAATSLSTPLSMLVVDPDTTQSLKMLLAEFLDVPITIQEREWLREAVRRDFSARQVQQAFGNA